MKIDGKIVIDKILQIMYILNKCTKNNKRKQTLASKGRYDIGTRNHAFSPLGWAETTYIYNLYDPDT